MTIAELGSVGEFIGAILLFISLIYLGIQIRQGNKAERLNATVAFEDQYRQNLQLWASSDEISHVMAKGLADMSSLTNSEIHLFGPRMYSLYRHAETAFQQHKKRLLDDDVLSRTMRVISLYHDEPGAQVWYAGHGQYMLTKEFCSFLDTCMLNMNVNS